MAKISQRLERILRKAIRPIRRALRPHPAAESLHSLSKPTLVLLAHPDDEVFCSGLISELRSRQTPVHLLLFTRGEGGDRGSLPAEADLGAEREKEMRLAAQQLDASSLTFLDYQDPTAIDGKLVAPTHNRTTLGTEIEAEVNRHGVAHLITHGSSGEYWHPAHLALHHAARQVANRNRDLTLWTFNAWRRDHPLPGILNQDDSTSLTLDASTHGQKRLASLRCHQSQAAVFEGFASGPLTDFIAQTATECYHKW